MLCQWWLWIVAWQLTGTRRWSFLLANKAGKDVLLTLLVAGVLLPWEAPDWAAEAAADAWVDVNAALDVRLRRAAMIRDSWSTLETAEVRRLLVPPAAPLPLPPLPLLGSSGNWGSLLLFIGTTSGWMSDVSVNLATRTPSKPAR